MHQQQRAFENIVGKGEIALNEQFLLFPQSFLHNQITVSPFVYIFDIISVFAAEYHEPKIGISGKGLRTKTFGNIVRSRTSAFKMEKKYHAGYCKQFLVFSLCVPTVFNL